ncbi:hypothetical protein V6N13_072023 [Hibiscus sabdariffa]
MFLVFITAALHFPDSDRAPSAEEGGGAGAVRVTEAYVGWSFSGTNDGHWISIFEWRDEMQPRGDIWAGQLARVMHREAEESRVEADEPRVGVERLARVTHGLIWTVGSRCDLTVMEKLNGINFLDWFRNLRIVLKQERKEYVIEEPVSNDPGANAPRADKDKFKKYMDDMVEVGCLMLGTMTPELQKQHEDMVAYEMIQNLKEIYEGQARQKRYETSKALFQ